MTCLRQEPGGEKIRSIFNQDGKATAVNFKSSPWSEILKADLANNVIRDGKQGTYRHLSLGNIEDDAEVQTEHALPDAKNTDSQQKERERCSKVKEVTSSRKRRINRTGWERTKKKNKLSSISSLNCKANAAATSSKPVRGFSSSSVPGKVTSPGFHYETSSIFDWDSYLEEVSGKPAPDRCFRQSHVLPVNEFRLDMKLEARDPRNQFSTTVATVVHLLGCRLQLRLLGSDKINDFFELVDSSSIQPIGTCDRNGEMLLPPLGITRNPAQWPIFMINALQNAAIALCSAFKAEPAENFFEVGIKLEAVDRKNPRLICPATVRAVKNNLIFVALDGWTGAFDFWCDYSSRDLFPIGWCKRSRHPLQPPGGKKHQFIT